MLNNKIETTESTVFEQDCRGYLGISSVPEVCGKFHNLYWTVEFRSEKLYKKKSGDEGGIRTTWEYYDTLKSIISISYSVKYNESTPLDKVTY